MVRLQLTRYPWLKWVMLLGFWTFLGLAFAAQFYLSRQRMGEPVSWSYALQRNLADWYGFAILSVPALWVGRHFPFLPGRWLASLAVHAPASALFSIAWIVPRAAFEHWQSQGELFAVTFTEAFSRALILFFLNLVIYWGVIVAQHAFAYYEKFHERELQTVELESRLAQARLQALQMQLNPHFLFNTLNAIASLMHQDVEAADRMISQLSDLLRYALESTSAQEVPLGQELAFIDRYLEIQKARFRDRLEIDLEIEPAALDARVPNLILQPLVENAIQHGIAPHARAGRIVLRARRQEERLELEIEDNGGGLPSGVLAREGIGISNTRARLAHLYGNRQSLEIQNGAQTGVHVRLTLPWHTGAF
jgi:signal transduction histidine kinase